MQENKTNGYVFYCDNCSNSIDTRETNFFTAVNSIKESGWKIVKSKDDWLHYCSQDCKDERKPSNGR